MLSRLFGRKAAATVTIPAAGRSLEAESGATILATALKAGIAYPSNCRVGSCGECRSRLVEGKVKPLTDFSYTLSAEDLAAGCILACQAVPRGPVTVEPVLPLRDLAGDERAAAGLPARIIEVTPLTADIRRVVLELDAPLPFSPGQYAAWTVPGVAAGRAYSFAAAPRAGETRIPFTIRHVPGGALTDWLFAADRRGEPLLLDGPFGRFGLKPGAGPALLIAGGSGLGPVLSLLEALAAAGERRRLSVLFGARTAADLYDLDRLAELARGLDLQIRPILSAEPADSGWAGERGLVTAPLAAIDLPETAALCGPPAMIDAAVAVLTARGLPASAISFDKFADARDGLARTAA